MAVAARQASWDFLRGAFIFFWPQVGRLLRKPTRDRLADVLQVVPVTTPFGGCMVYAFTDFKSQGQTIPKLYASASRAS